MMNKKEKIVTLITNSLSLLIALLVLVPFGKSTVSNGEVVFKALIAPIIVCVIFIINAYIKYVVGTNEYKYTSFSAYMGVFAYIVALFGYTIETLLRTGAGTVYSVQAFVALTALFVLLAALFAALGIFMQKFAIFLKNKESIFIDILAVLFIIALSLVVKLVLAKHIGVAMDNSVLQYVVVPLLFGIAVALIIVFVMLNYLKYNDKFEYESRKELLDEWTNGREAVYQQAQLDILYNLYNFSKKELGIEDEELVLEEVEEEAPAEEAPVEEAPAEEVPVEEAPAEEAEPEVDEAALQAQAAELAAVEEKLEELQKAKDELLNTPEEETPVKEPTVYPPKTFKPTFGELVRYAEKIEGATYVANAEGTNYKFSVGKKFFLQLVDGPKSYKLVFLMDFPEAAKFSQTNAFAKAKSPKGEYVFRLVNKGEFSAQELKDVIKGSYKMLTTIKEREDAAKAAEKARKAEEKLQAKLAEMDPAAREKYLKRLEESKKTPEQKAQEAAEKKAKAEEAKQKEKERLAAEKAKEKEKEAAQKAKEKEKLAAQKAKEKEKEAAQKAKEKEKLAAQKAKEKEKLAAQKAKEKEKLAAQKAKEKEAAKKAEKPAEAPVQEAPAEEQKAE